MSHEGQSYDVFLSYNSRDREEVAKIAAFLRKRGLRVFFAIESLAGGDSWLRAVAQAITSCQAVVVVQGRERLSKWQQKEVDLALVHQTEKKPGLKIIPVLLPGADPALDFVLINHRIELEPGFDVSLTSLERLAAALGSAGVLADLPPQESAPAISPYRGLLPFREEDSSFYFGRESFVRSLRETVEANSLTALVGPSGSGKSSLVHAGLFPDLRRSGAPGTWQAVSIRPGPHPISSLSLGLTRLLRPDTPPLSQEGTAAHLAEALLHGEETLESLSVKALRDAGQPAGKLLLVVDQWEELYTLDHEDEDERDRFLAEILAATKSSSISVLLLFRGDFYGRVMEHPELRRRLKGDCLISLPDMSLADLRRAVEEPARKVGLSFEDGLVDDILQDLERQPGQLPLLEFVLAQLWSERDSGNQKFLHSSYAAMGRLRGALARKADEITRALPEAEVRRLFLRLVRVEEDAPVTRRRARCEDLDQPTLKIASRFIDDRLLVSGWDAKTGEEIVEVAHEALLHHWRRLGAWLKEHRAFLLWREQLEHDATEWIDNGQQKTFLLTAGPLQMAEIWLAKHAEDLSPEAQGYIRLGVEKKRRDERRRRLRRSAVAALVLASLGLGGLVLYFKAGKDSARSAALAAEAERLGDRKLDLALLLAVQAGKTKLTTQALGATLSLTAGNPALRHFLRRPEPPAQKGSAHGPRAEEILATAFGGGLIAAGGIGKVYLWDAQNGTLQGAPLDTGEPSQVVSLAFSPDGSLLASGSETGGLIRLWNLHKKTELDPIPTDGSTQNLTFDSRGERLAWRTPSRIHLWDLRRGAEIGHIPRETSAKESSNWFSDLSFSPSGEMAWTTATGHVNLWEPGRAPQPLAEAGGSVLGVAFAPDGALLSAGSSFHRWDPGSGAALREPCSLLAAPKDEVISVAFSPDRSFLASGHLDRKIRVWDVSKEGCPLTATLSGHSGLIWTIAFGPDTPGKRLSLVSGGEEGDLILWELTPLTPTFSIPLGKRSPRGVTTLAVSPDGALVAVGDSLGQVTLYDGQNGKKRLDSQTSRNQKSIYCMAFSADGRTLATGGPEGHVLLWDVGSHKLRVSSLLRTEGGADPIRSLAFSRDDAWVAAGTKSGRLLAWQPAVSNTPVLSPQKLPDGPVLALTFLTETRTFPWMNALPGKREEALVAASGGNLTLWDLEKKRILGTVEDAHSQAITSLAARPDGLLASGSLDRNVRLWRLRQSLKAEDTLFLGWRVTDLDLSPHGDRLAAAGDDGTSSGVVLWDLKTRIPIGQGFQVPGALRRVAFDPTGESLYLAGKAVSAWWDLRPETWSRRACDMVRRTLSPLEKDLYSLSAQQAEACASP